jgi:hypothetical protein
MVAVAHSMGRRGRWILLPIVALTIAALGLTRPDGGRVAAQPVDEPLLILVSFDGFRWDYLDRAPRQTCTASRTAGCARVV